MIQIGIIGSGNVATHLAQGLYDAGLPIRFICSRNVKTGTALAKSINTGFVKSVPPATDKNAILFVCTSDNAILDLILQHREAGYILVHCSGSVAMINNSSLKDRTGVLYPVQTFSTGVPVNWSAVPICIEAGNRKVLVLLRKIAKLLSRKVTALNSDQRLIVHLSAVFANNFTNAQYVIAEMLLKEHNLSFDLIKPLISTTALKVQQISPAYVQTGPAMREDMITIKSHNQLLKSKPEFKQIYQLLTDFIMHNIKDKNKHQ